jgi:hypothetical protein
MARAGCGQKEDGVTMRVRRDRPEQRRRGRWARSTSGAAVAVATSLLGLGLVAPPRLAAVRRPVSKAPLVTPVRRQAPTPLPSGALVVGNTPPSTRLHVQVFLAPADRSGLKTFVHNVSTPGSPSYRHYLTPATFARRFGASSAEVASVRHRLVSAGAMVGRLAPNHLSFPVTLSVAQAAAVFGARFEEAILPDGRLVRDPASDVALPEGVDAVVGLSDARRATGSLVAGPGPVHVPAALVAHPAAATSGYQPSSGCQAASDAGLPPSVIAGVYDFGPLYQLGLDGAGTTIAVLELSAFHTSLVQNFQQCFGTSLTESVTTVDGGPVTQTGSPDYSSQVEPEADLEEIAAVAPDAHVDVYEAPNSESAIVTAWDDMVQADQAEILSSSWIEGCDPMYANGASNPSLAAEQEIFQEAAAQGQTVLAAAGDTGSEGCATFLSPSASGYDQLATEEPASNPDVLGVGGTEIEVTSSPTVSQTTWNQGVSTGQPAAGGGGFSSVWARPSWQQGNGVGGPWPEANACGSTGSAPCREVPDVAASADPDTGYPAFTALGSSTNGQWIPVGGTSLATPLWAGLLGLVDEACPATPVGLVAPALYKAANGPNDPFQEITTGNNDALGTNGGLYPAGPGDNPATGLGTPVAATLLQDLNPPCPSVSLSTTSLAFGVVTPGTQPSASLTITNTGAGALSVSQVTLAGPGASDFRVAADTCEGSTVQPAGSCQVTLDASSPPSPAEADLTITDNAPGSPQVVPVSASGPGQSAPSVSGADGYWIASSDGGVFAFGSAPFLGSVPGVLGPDRHLDQPVVGIAPTASGQGYWLAAADGGVFAFGDAPYLGSLPAILGSRAEHLAAPIVAIAADPTGAGYWLLGADGGVFAFGGAPYLGSIPALVGSGQLPSDPMDARAIVPTPTGEGYWIVGAHGGVYSFGDASFFGSVPGVLGPGQTLAADVVKR